MQPQPKQTLMDRFALRWADVVLRFRFLTILVALILVTAFAAGLTRLDVSTNYRVFFSDHNPDLQALEEFEATFTRADNFLFVLKPREGDVRDARVLQAVEELTERAWGVPFNTRVNSISNFQYTYADGDELIVEDLVENAGALSLDQVLPDA